MDITTDRPRDDVAVVALTGELDASNFEQVIDTARRLTADGAHHLILDLSGLSFMGSSGLVAIHSIALLMRGQEPPSPEHGWQAIHDVGAADDAESGLLLAGAPPSIERVLDRSGMLGLFPVHPDRSSAVTAAAG